MKLKLKSKTLKRVFKNNEIELNSEEGFSLHINNNSKVPTITDVEEKDNIILDYSNIFKEIQEPKEITFSNIPQDLLEELLMIKTPNEILGIYNSEIDFSELPNVNYRVLKKIVLINIKSPDDTLSRLEQVTEMENLESICIKKFDGLDLDAFFRDISNPEKIKSLTLTSKLPTSEIMSRYTNLEEIDVSMIKDSKKLIDFLNSLPLEKLKSLRIVSSDLNNLTDEIINRLEKLEDIKIIANSNANYNQIIQELPCKESLQSIYFANINMNYNIFPRLFASYTNLHKLQLSLFSINENELHTFLKFSKTLKNLEFSNMNFRNLDFISEINPEIELLFRCDNMYFSMLTPEIAKQHKKIFIMHKTGENIETTNTKQGEYNLKASVNSKKLYSIDKLMEGAESIFETNIEVCANSNGISQVEGFLLPYEKKIQDSGYKLTIEDTSVLSVEQLENLNRNRKLKGIAVLDFFNGESDYSDRFTYTPDVYKKIKGEIHKIISDIPDDFKDEQKFMIIYTRLARKIRYDYGMINENEYSQYAKENVDDSRNMVNALLKNKAVCAGLVDATYNCLREKEIEAHKITGIGGGEYHQWIVSRLNGICYKSDITWDDDIAKNKKVRNLPNCLLSDRDFDISHQFEFGFQERCPETYNRGQVADLLNFVNAFEKSKNSFLLKIKAKIMQIFSKNKRLLLPEFTSSSQEYKEDLLPNSKNVSSPSWELSHKEKQEINRKILSGKDGINLNSEERNNEDRQN